MTARALWLRLAGVWTTAAALLLAGAPAPPAASWQASSAVAIGLAAGIVLFLALGGAPAGLAPPSAATAVVLVLAASAEEVVWRWFALAELAARTGAGPALVATSALFALAHRPISFGQLLAGATFGLVYLGTGSLAGACCAHAVYNLCAASTGRGASP